MSDVLRVEYLTAFVLNYIFKDVYITNNLDGKISVFFWSIEQVCSLPSVTKMFPPGVKFVCSPI